MGYLEIASLALKVIGTLTAGAVIVGGLVWIWKQIQQGAINKLKVEQLEDSAERREDQDEAQHKAHHGFWDRFRPDA